MTPQDMEGSLASLEARLAEIGARLSDPEIYSRHRESAELLRERQKLDTLFENYRKWIKALKDLDDNHVLLAGESEEGLRELISADIGKLEAEAALLEKTVISSILPPDAKDSGNVIVEIKPAAGGEEAALFASELFRAYMYFAERRSWKREVLSLNESELGGLREVMFSLLGDDVFTMMKHESGVHRVQRVPATESGGRIHTSTVTVSVLPEADEVEVKINPEDLRIDVFRSSGPGGQSVNTTDSAVRVTHIPTGTMVASQQEKSQHRNKEIAMRILRARLLERQEQEDAARHAATKRAQVGSGERSERIRTYNFPQNRVTDHRYNVSVHNLPRLLDGDFELILEPILQVECERRLADLKKVGK
ncbi:MAG: peptide chain release factor 1 [Victivallales bacterium]|nr:peptide chain release factor 1 [Victivallales bacterium]